MVATANGNNQAYISTVSDRANKEWANSADQYQWAKDQFNKNQGTSDKVVNQALDTGTNFGNYAATDRGDYESMTRPAMKQQMDFAKDYASPSRMMANRSSAISGSNMAAEAARAAAEQNLQSFGVDPSSGKFAGLDAGLAAKKAAMAASAGTTSDRNTEMLGQQYLSNAIKTGQVLPGQAATEAGVGMAAGNQAVNAGLATTASGSATMGTPIQWAGLGDDSIKQWLAATSEADQTNLAQQKLDQSSSSGTGAAIGAGLGILGSVAGSYFGPMGSMAGGALGKAAGGAMSGGTSPANQTGGLMNKGGTVPRLRAGGAVPPAYNDDDDDDDEDLHQQPYRPGEDREQMQLHHQDAERDFDIGDETRPNWPQSDSFHEARPQWEGRHPGDQDEDGYRDGGQVETNHMQEADDEMQLSPEEKSLYERHWMNLHGKGGVNNPDGTRSTISNMTGEHNGQTYNVPTVYEGRHLDPDQAWRRAEEQGLDTFPHSSSRDYVDQRYDRMHGFMERDTTQKGYAQGGEITPDVSQGGGQPGGQQGNMVPQSASPSGGASEGDDVHAMLQADEFVVPKDVAKWYGEKYFQGLIEKARKEMVGATAQAEPTTIPHAIAISPPAFKSEGARA
jgi:hypothetical protein